MLKTLSFNESGEMLTNTPWITVPRDAERSANSDTRFNNYQRGIIGNSQAIRTVLEQIA